MNSSWKNSKHGAYFFIVLLGILTVLGNAESNNAPPMKVEMQNGNLLIKAHDANLGALLEKISSVCQIGITGLAERKNETITFTSGNGSIECELKRLLRYLQVENYSFEYEDDRLRIVTVFPSSKIERPVRPGSSDKRQGIKKRQSKVVQVEGIVEGSQAEILNLVEGDLVISYDNTNISTAKQLVSLVRSKPDWEKFDMIVVRNGSPIKLVVNGGQIGIRIKTVQIPSETLKQYRSYY